MGRCCTWWERHAQLNPMVHHTCLVSRTSRPKVCSDIFSSPGFEAKYNIPGSSPGSLFRGLQKCPSHKLRLNPAIALRGQKKLHGICMRLQFLQSKTYSKRWQIRSRIALETRELAFQFKKIRTMQNATRDRGRRNSSRTLTRD